jgi:hypothetical protein
MRRVFLIALVVAASLVFPVPASADDPVVCTTSGSCGWVGWDDQCWNPATQSYIEDCNFEGF